MFSLKIDSSGAERHFKELSRAAEALNAPINVEFNPADATDVQRAISQIESAIDERIGPFRRNRDAQQLADELKARFREQIMQKAESAAQQN
jgi:hypothetical protein